VQLVSIDPLTAVATPIGADNPSYADAYGLSAIDDQNELFYLVSLNIELTILQ
jgi:hypothetical protein